MMDVSLKGMECRSAFGILLPFTTREWIEPLQVELNCKQLFGMHCRGLVGHCVLTVNHLQLMHEDVYTDCTWKSIYTDDALPPMKKKSKFTALGLIVLILLARSAWRSLVFQSALMV